MKIIYVLSIAGWAFLAWLGFSWLDVISHQLTGAAYSAFNFFFIIL